MLHFGLETAYLFRYAMTSLESSNRSPDRSAALRECEARLRDILELSSDWYWEQDKNYRFTLLTGRALAKLEIDPKTCLGTARWDLGAVPIVDDGNWDKHKAVLETRQAFNDFTFKRPSSQGKVHFVVPGTTSSGLARKRSIVVSSHVIFEFFIAAEYSKPGTLPASRPNRPQWRGPTRS